MKRFRFATIGLVCAVLALSTFVLGGCFVFNRPNPNIPDIPDTPRPDKSIITSLRVERTAWLDNMSLGGQIPYPIFVYIKYKNDDIEYVATSSDVLYSVDDESVLTVDASGFIVPKELGTTTITITALKPNVDGEYLTDSVQATVTG